jgi:hypothetical protein
MDKPSVDTVPGCAPASTLTKSCGPLLELLLSDAANDIEVVSRELGLREEMCERLRRAFDRIACAQSVLESIGPDGAEAGKDGAAAEVRMRAAVVLLAREWPEDYPAGAVEWGIAQEVDGRLA